MKLYTISMSLCVLLLSVCGGKANASAVDLSQASTPKKPNILMIVVDDLGWSDVGYNQTTDLFETPNIDELSKQGLRFDQAYAGAANCAPSRAVLMSGQYGPRHGVYTVSPSARGNEYRCDYHSGIIENCRI